MSSRRIFECYGRVVTGRWSNAYEKLHNERQILVTIYCYYDPIKENGLLGIYSMNGRDEKYIKNFRRKS
jgi:hypothetical protein